jgi:hypothetical protein
MIDLGTAFKAAWQRGYADGIKAERERIRQLAIKLDASCNKPCPDGHDDCIHQDASFADLLADLLEEPQPLQDASNKM